MTFKGKISVNAKDSVPDLPEIPKPHEGAPNIVLIMLDDVGFGETSAFGGLAQTPNLERLAASGIRYNKFHTAGICAPTRAALLSGRNQHRLGFGSFGGVGFPGYDGLWKNNSASIAKILRQAGYNTAAFGKWHNTPYHEITPVGPFDRWPTNLGFEYFYGNFMGGASQWEPQLWRNLDLVEPARARAPGYHFTSDIVDEAIGWLNTHESLASDRPYFLYFAPLAVHSPHHVPQAWIDGYRGKFERGWDALRQEIFIRQKALGVVPENTVLTTRPAQVPSWSSLSNPQRELFARQMEVYAGFISHTDHEIGRLLEVIRNSSNVDNTLIVLIVGDNGPEAAFGIDGTDNAVAKMSGLQASVQEQLNRAGELGGPKHFNMYSAGWAWMGSTPFQWMKHIASHFGGTRNPMLISWPRMIQSKGGVRSQFSYITDITPTLLEAAGVEPPEYVDGIRQISLDGESLVYSFNNASAPSKRRVQYFEASGNRAIYKDGWVASAMHAIPWSDSDALEFLNSNKDDFSADRWELYNIDHDFSESNNLAAKYPDKLNDLKAVFDQEAWKNNVYPLGAGTKFLSPAWAQGRREVVLHRNSPTMLSNGLPDLAKPYRITAEVVLRSPGAEGTILSIGSRFGGVALYMKDGRLIYENNISGNRRELLQATRSLGTGKSEIVVELSQEEQPNRSIGSIEMYINGELIGQRDWTLASAPIGSLIKLGGDTSSPVTNAFAMPSEFDGAIECVKLESMERKPKHSPTRGQPCRAILPNLSAPTGRSPSSG